MRLRRYLKISSARAVEWDSATDQGGKRIRVMAATHQSERCSSVAACTQHAQHRCLRTVADICLAVDDAPLYVLIQVQHCSIRVPCNKTVLQAVRACRAAHSDARPRHAAIPRCRPQCCMFWCTCGSVVSYRVLSPRELSTSCAARGCVCVVHLVSVFTVLHDSCTCCAAPMLHRIL